MMHCLVIDDEPYARKLLEEFIGKTPDLQWVGSYASALKARETLGTKPVDVIFLDIQMPDLTGIDFLKTFDKRPKVILTTAFAEYALEGFELDVVDYLLKPFDFNRFLKAVNKLQQQPTAKREEPATTSPQFIFVKEGARLVRIDLNTLLYVKGTREYVTLVMPDRKIMSLQSMKKLEQELPSTFVRIHNSFIVNLAAIQVVNKDDVEIQGESLPIGATHKKIFLEKLQSFVK